MLDAAKERETRPADLWNPLVALNEAGKVPAHFKRPLHPGSLLERTVALGRPDFVQAAAELAEADAFAGYEAARSLVQQARWP